MFWSLGSFLKSQVFDDGTVFVWTYSEYFVARKGVSLKNLDIKEDVEMSINQNTSYAMLKDDIENGTQVPSKVLERQRKFMKETIDPEDDPFKSDAMRKTFVWNLYNTPSLKDFLLKAEANAGEDGDTLKALTETKFFDKMLAATEESVDETYVYIKEVAKAKGDFDTITMLVGFKKGKWVDPRVFQASFKVNNYNPQYQVMHMDFMRKRQAMLNSKFKGVREVIVDGKLKIRVKDHEVEHEGVSEFIKGLKHKATHKATQQSKSTRRLYQAEIDGAGRPLMTNANIELAEWYEANQNRQKSGKTRRRLVEAEVCQGDNA